MESSTLVPVLSYILTKMIERNDKIALDDSKRTVFHALKAPIISLQRYLERVLSFAPCSNSCFIIALIYIDRIIQNNPSFVLNSLSVHRMLITSVMVATKFFDDETFNNLYYAKVGGLQVSELNQLENKFLSLIGFTLTIRSDLFDRYHAELMKHAKVNSCAKVVAPLRPKLSQSQHETRPCPKPVAPLSRSTSSITHSSSSSSNSLSQSTCALQHVPTVRDTSNNDARYQSGVDYASRDCIPSSSSTDVSIDFGTLTVSGANKGRQPGSFTQCTPSYPSGGSHHRIPIML